MSSLSEHLANQFRAWEQRGRGWQVYGYPVVLEPPFRPFAGYIPLPSVGRDDGRRAGLAESVWNSLRGRRVEQAARPAAREFDEPEAEADPESDALVELQIRLPSRTDVSPELAQRLVSNLLASQEKLGFELLGIGPEIILQFVVPQSHADAFRAAIETYIPDVCIAEQETLSEAWEANAADETVVVEFGLSNEFLLPLAAPRSFRIDPLLDFLSTLEALDEDELGLVQVLFEPVRHPWARSAIQWLTGTDGTPLFADAGPLLQGASEKFGTPLVAAVVRVAGRAESSERAWAIARRLGGAFAQFSAANELIPLDRAGYEPFDQEHDLVRRRSHRGGMLLSISELVGLVHVPASSVRSEHLREEPRKTKAPPEAVRAGEVRLGENTHRGTSTDVLLPLATRLRHTHVVGATGTGKSTLLKSLIRQDLENGRGIAVLDPHGDLADEVLGLVPDERMGDVVLLDPSDEEFPVGFNVLAAHSDRERNLLASDLTAIFRRFSTTWGDQMTAVMSSAVMALLESNTPRTLLDLRRFLADREFREAVLVSVQDPLLLSFWREEFPRLPGARSQLPITTRLDAFLRPKSIRNMVAQPQSRLDLRRLMDSGGTLVGKLSQGAIGEENAHLLGSLLVAKLHQLAMSREQLPESARTPFVLYIDEFHHFLTPSLTGLLSGARKYGVGLVLAHQEMRQIVDPEIRGAVLANPATRICFRLGDEDARLLASGFSAFDAGDLVNLGVGDALCRVGQSSHDFNLRVCVPTSVDAVVASARRDAATATTRERFGTPRFEVERWIASMWQPTRPSSPSRGAVRTPPPPPASATAQAIAAPPPPPPTPVPLASPTLPIASPQPQVPPETPVGRGGPQHQYLQSLVAGFAQSHGYRATVEAPMDGGKADVLLERGSERIAVEISITTSAEHEWENATKCLAGGATLVALIAPSAAALRRLRDAARDLPEEARARLLIGPAEDLLARLAPPEPAKTVLGYKVKTTVKGSEGGEGPKRQAIAQAIASALKRLKRS